MLTTDRPRSRRAPEDDVPQIKEVGPSVHAVHVGRSRYGNQGQRVVAGQRLMQQVSDIFLGWQHARSGDRIAIFGYLGSSTAFDEALADFAEAYTDRTESDHRQLADAVAAGEVTAERDL